MTYVSFLEKTINYLWDMEKCSQIRAKQLRDFKSLDNKALEKILASSESITLPKGSVVFTENQHLNKLYCIKEGACKFSTVDNAGQEHILRFLGQGDIMGKRAILSNRGAKVSATTLTETKLCCIDKDGILENLKSNTEFCNDLLNALIEDINTNEHTRIIFCSHKGIKQRLASLLLYLAEKYGQDETGKILLKIKREDMASVLGTSQEYIINLLAKFKDKDLLTVKRREIILLSKERLQELI